MSKCISEHGEYSGHEFTDADELVCAWCHVFDEDKALAIITKLRESAASVDTLVSYVTSIINDSKYGHDIEWVRSNLRPDHMRRVAGATPPTSPPDVAALKRALAGHLFDGESVSTREAVRNELMALGFEADQAVERVRALHEPVWSNEFPPGGKVCRQCGVPVESEPCDTVRALETGCTLEREVPA